MYNCGLTVVINEYVMFCYVMLGLSNVPAVNFLILTNPRRRTVERRILHHRAKLYPDGHTVADISRFLAIVSPIVNGLRCFDTVGWAAGRASGL